MKIPVKMLKMREDLVYVEDEQEIQHLRKLCQTELSQFFVKVEREYYVEIYGTETYGQFIVRILKQSIRKVLP